jgi:hypothetical protein
MFSGHDGRIGMSDANEQHTVAVNWPGIVLHEGDPELLYVPDLASWERDAGVHAADYRASDCLIDSTGRVFTLAATAGQRVIPQPRGDTKSLEEILGLVKAHAAQAGSCCVARFYASSIREAFCIVQTPDDGAR